MKTNLELKHLRVFVAVVEAGGHTRAAATLGISQSTVSETLTALERTVGAVLFRKTAKGSLLTPCGEALLPYARRTLALTSEMMVELAKVSCNTNARLVVAAVESVSAYVLPSRLAALRERWPRARMEVVTAVCSEIRDSVATGKSDLGLILEAEAGLDDESILAKSRLVIVGSRTHPLAGKKPMVDELAECDFYLSDSAGEYHQILRHYFEAAQIPLPRVQALGSIEGVKRGILAGGTGLGLLPAHAVERELVDGELTEICIRPALRGLVLRAVRRAETSASPLVDDLVVSLRRGTVVPIASRVRNAAP